jgi:hypothetical protein
MEWNESLVLEVCTRKHKKHTCIEELTQENTYHNVTHLGRFGTAAYLVNNGNNNHSNDSVDDNDTVLDHLID